MRKILLLLPFFLWTCGGGGGSTEPEPPQLPTVSNIEVSTLEDTAKTFALTGTDPNNLTLTYSISTQPQHGTISISGGAATYSPNANYHGQDVIAFLASSTSGNSNIGTIIITITPVDDEPNTMDVTATTDEDNSVQITLEAEEYDGENIEFQVRNNPSNGSVTISGTTAIYTPNENWYGTDQFNFEAVDSSSRSVLNIATATIDVNSVNDAPTIEGNIIEDVFYNSSLDLTINASDVEGDEISFQVVQNPNYGTASFDGNILQYTSNSSSDVEDIFYIVAYDGTNSSQNVQVAITSKGTFRKIYKENEYESFIAEKMIRSSDGGYIIIGSDNVGNIPDTLIFKLQENGNIDFFIRFEDVGSAGDVVEKNNDIYVFTSSGHLKIINDSGEVISETNFGYSISEVFETLDGGFLLFQNNSLKKTDSNFQIEYELNEPGASNWSVVETDEYFIIKVKEQIRMYDKIFNEIYRQTYESYPYGEYDNIKKIIENNINQSTYFMLRGDFVSEINISNGEQINGLVSGIGWYAKNRDFISMEDGSLNVLSTIPIGSNLNDVYIDNISFSPSSSVKYIETDDLKNDGFILDGVSIISDNDQIHLIVLLSFYLSSNGVKKGFLVERLKF